MKISYNWLKQYADVPASPDDVAEMLTGCGLEVEGIEKYESVKGGLDGIVVGEVLEKSKHPNADKLSITKVNIGDGHTYQIVCGASNVEAGQKVVIAKPGARLYPVKGEPFEIKKSKIRGEVSEGMICAEDEIGLGESHEGIMVLNPGAVIGQLAAEYFKLEADHILEIGLTPNRADATSHIGVARDVVAVWNTKNKLEGATGFIPAALAKPKADAFSATFKCPVQVTVANPADCPRYSGVYIRDMVVKESPDWLKKKLMAVGLKPINNVVDVTNFVMLETGQPLHAFDADKIQGMHIIVKKLASNTPFITLDGSERKLGGEELMICDEKGGLCIAGVYGGIDSGVSAGTKNIFIESACFNPAMIRKGAKYHGLKTDASFRFERGTDPEITIYALKRAALLIKEMVQEAGVSEIIDHYPVQLNPAEVTLQVTKLNEITGVSFDQEIVLDILNDLEINVVASSANEIRMTVPLFKPDVKRPIDVTEEILRIYGYNRVDLPAKMNSCLPRFFRPDRLTVQLKVSGYLAAQGFNEMMGNSLTRTEYAAYNGLPGSAISMLNPLSNDLAILRQSLLFSGLEAVAYNKNRKNPDLRLYEFGKIYFKEGDKYKEENHLHLLMSGKRNKPNWIPQQEQYSLYYLKSLAGNILTAAGFEGTSELEFELESSEMFAVCLSVKHKKTGLARLGTIKKQVLKNFDLDGDLFFADIDMDTVLKRIAVKDKIITESPKYPEVKRDLSMIIGKEVSFEKIEKTAFDSERKFLKRIQLFDVYEGEKMEPGKKSYAISFILGDAQKTLEDKQIDGIMERLMKHFEEDLGALIRKS